MLLVTHLRRSSCVFPRIGLCLFKAFLTRRLMMLFSSDRTVTLCGLLLRPLHDSTGNSSTPTSHTRWKFFWKISRYTHPTLFAAVGGMDGHVCACAILKVWRARSPAKIVYACSAKNDTWSISGNVIGSEAKMRAKCCSDERSDGSFFCQWQRCNFLPL